LPELDPPFNTMTSTFTSLRVTSISAETRTSVPGRLGHPGMDTSWSHDELRAAAFDAAPGERYLTIGPRPDGWEVRRAYPGFFLRRRPSHRLRRMSLLVTQQSH
jgi:hypothetical protein